MQLQATLTCGVCYCVLLLLVLPGAGDAVPPVNSRDICYRDVPTTLASRTLGDNGFRIRLSGIHPDTYAPGEVYTVTVNGTYPNQKLIGFMLVAVPEHAQDESVSMGTFQHFSHGLTKFAESCPWVVTHTYNHPKAGVDVLWTAPPSGAGCVTFRATVIEYPDIWYKDDGALTKVICEEAQSAEIRSQELPQQDCCACGTGKYQMTFKGLWSRQTHPKDWPQHKRLLHWSNIVGTSHSKDYVIWQYGGYASKGVKEVCEFGYTRTLEQEMRQHSRDVRTVVKTPGIWWSDPDGLRQTRWARFSVDRRNHLLTMLTMLGPSPDWCVGVSSLNLCLPNCTWAGDMTIDLYPWDAGTDDGITYMSPNMKSEPQQKIFAITNAFPNDSQSPFFGPRPITPLAQLIIHRINPKPGASTICYGNETDDGDQTFDPFEGDSTDTKPKAGQISMELKKLVMMSGLSELDKNKITMNGLTVDEKKKLVMMSERLTDMEKSKVIMLLDSIQEPTNNMEMFKKAVMMSGLSQMEQDKLFMDGLSDMEREKIIRMSGISSMEKDKLVMLLRGPGEAVEENPGPSDTEMELKKVVMMSGLSEAQKNMLLMGDLSDMEREKLVMMSDVTDMEKHKIVMLLRQVADDRQNIAKCAVSPWLDWSECSVTCGVGERIRKRMFKHPLGSEAMCNMDSMQVENCIGVENECESLADNCALTNWSDWSPCSVTCGKGIQERRRYYLRQEDTQRCVRQTQDRRVCTASEHDCQKALTMKNFTAICSLPKDVGPCRGHFERFYFDEAQGKCLEFTYGGCRGNNNRFRTFEECTEMCVFMREDDDTEDVEETAGETGEQVEKKKKKKRKNKKKNKNEDKDNEDKEENEKTVASDLQSDNEIEKISCKVSDWSTWSGCSATCGESYKFKRRMILVAPEAGGKKCPKKLERKRPCKVPQCNEETPVDCEATSWSAWSSCSATCGQGFKYRRRTVLRHPQFGGKKCPHKLERKRKCKLRECSTDCVLGPWGEWTPCTKTCGYDSIQERSRQVLHNHREDGAPCPARLERRYCQLPKCL